MTCYFEVQIDFFIFDFKNDKLNFGSENVFHMTFFEIYDNFQN